MAELTTKELSSIKEQLNREESLTKKYLEYATMCADPQLQSKCQQVAAQHQNHYNTLLNQLR